jgi:hypothetical protein
VAGSLPPAERQQRDACMVTHGCIAGNPAMIDPVDQWRAAGAAR